MESPGLFSRRGTDAAVRLHLSDQTRMIAAEP